MLVRVCVPPCPPLSSLALHQSGVRSPSLWRFHRCPHRCPAVAFSWMVSSPSPPPAAASPSPFPLDVAARQRLLPVSLTFASLGLVGGCAVLHTDRLSTGPRHRALLTQLLPRLLHLHCHLPRTVRALTPLPRPSPQLHCPTQPRTGRGTDSRSAAGRPRGRQRTAPRQPHSSQGGAERSCRRSCTRSAVVGRAEGMAVVGAQQAEQPTDAAADGWGRADAERG